MKNGTDVSRMSVSPLAIAGVKLIRPRIFADLRGRFVETYNQTTFAEAGIATVFMQDNESSSIRRGTVRGLHFQAPPFAQTKLVRVVRGAVYDVAIDLRRTSPEFGRWCAATLTADTGEQLLIPAGFAHGFCTLEDETIVSYKVDSPYSPTHEMGILWNDPELAIEWPVAADQAVIAERDRRLRPLRDLDSPFA